MTRPAYPDPAFWNGRRVLLTGHTGFKGAWLAFWLHVLGAKVSGLALAPASSPSLFSLLDLENKIDSRIGDIRDAEAVHALMRETQPEVVLHLAAQALVRPAYRDPLTTFSTNVMGTAHVLDAMRKVTGVKVGVMVTTDKVYHNREWVWPYREDDALGGHDPYSASKAASEMAIESWRLSFLNESGVAVASARAGNVIGGGDWSEDRLLPDAVRAWQSGATLEIRRPQAVRPWQHVLEPLGAYLALAEKLWQQPALAGAYNFGPRTHEAASVRDVVELARSHFPNAAVEYGDGSSGPHEAGWLALETARARQMLDVSPRFTLQESVDRSMNWYAALHAGTPAPDLCRADIEAWMSAA